MIILYIIKWLILIVPLLLGVAYMTLTERKVMGSMQRRIGPNITGIYGLLQPFADALKLLIKETILPSVSNINLFIMAPIITLSLSFIGWTVIPFGRNIVLSDINLSILFILAISSLTIYGVIFAGWSSNNKWSLIGGLRSSAQMISYEISIGLIIMCVLLTRNTFNLSILVETQKSIWFIIPLFPLFIMFYISIIAETNRAPFDLPEAESELVSGFFTEYSALSFAFFFLAEYSSMILMSTFASLLFLGGWGKLIGFSLGIKTSLLLMGFVWIRASLPRYKYTDLISLMWKILLPLSIGFFLLIGGILITFDWII